MGFTVISVPTIKIEITNKRDFEQQIRRQLDLYRNHDLSTADVVSNLLDISLILHESSAASFFGLYGIDMDRYNDLRNRIFDGETIDEKLKQELIELSKRVEEASIRLQKFIGAKGFEIRVTATVMNDMKATLTPLDIDRQLRDIENWPTADSLKMKNEKTEAKA